jgi:OmpA-OmpF porin, OOP family
MKSIARIALGAVCFISMSSIAAAGPDPQPSGKFYVGLDVGSSDLDATVSQQFFGPQVRQESGSDVGFKARFGIQISRYFAVEAGYVDFGEFTLRDIPYSCAPQQPGPCTYDVSSQTHGPFANLVVSWPFAERWALNGRLGGYYADISTSERDPDVPGTQQSYSDSGIGLQIGGGFSFQLDPRMTLSLDYGRYDVIDFGLAIGGGVGVYDVGSSSLVSLGFAYRF